MYLVFYTSIYTNILYTSIGIKCYSGLPEKRPEPDFNVFANWEFTFSWDLTGTSLWQPAVLAETVSVLTRNN